MEFNIDFYSIILIMPLTIMVLMKYAEKCPKCGGFVQTKSLNKSIGFGSVDIPVAQFCLNPVCDWYQDFAEARRPEDIKEGYHLKAPSIKGKLPRINTPVLSRNYMIALGGIVAIVIIYSLISFLTPVSNLGDESKAQLPELSNNNNYNNNTSTITQEIPKIPTALPTINGIEVKIEPKSIIVKMSVGYGFFPDTITINMSDTIIWINDEGVRPRVVLVSRDGLFNNQFLQNPGRYEYQFNKSGKYTFNLAEYGTNKEYPVNGSVIVK